MLGLSMAVWQVLWSTIAAVCELKPSLVGEHYQEALGQVADRMQALFQLQPQRMWCYGVVGGSSSLEVLLFHRQDPGKGSFSIKHTGLLSFSCHADSDGFKLLASLLQATHQQLGFKHAEMEPG